MSDKFAVKITEDKDGTTWFSITHNNYQWSSLRIETIEQMEVIARAILDEIDKRKGDIGFDKSS